MVSCGFLGKMKMGLIRIAKMRSGNGGGIGVWKKENGFGVRFVGFRVVSERWGR